MKNTINGSCLCGSVQIEAQPKKEIFDACHCGMCRKWSGSPALMIEGDENTKYKGQEFITIYDSSDWAQRGFCKKCGTHLFYKLKGANYSSVSMGLFKETEKFKFHVQIYVDSKPACYDFANQTQMMTEAEVIAKFSGKS